MVVSSSTLNNPDFNQSYPEDFRFQFTSGLSNSFSVHPFAKNTGLKFGINYQIDFVRLLPVTYQSTFSNNNNAEVDYREVLDAALPYLGEMVGKFTNWTPLEYRGVLFPEDVDRDDPWQFKNVRVT